MPIPLIGWAAIAVAVTVGGLIFKAIVSPTEEDTTTQSDTKNIKVPNIFISHRWAYKEDYESLTKKLKENNFYILDYSVPEDDSFDTQKKKELEDALRKQVAQCNVFIIFANMAMKNGGGWIEKEVEFAKEYEKPILAIKPHGYQGNIPKFIQDAAGDENIIGFNTPNIIKRIETILTK